MLTEQIMKSSPLSRIIVSVSMVILIGLAAYNWAVSPQTAYLHASQQYNEMNDTVQRKTVMLRKLVAVKKKKLNAIKGQLTELESDFFTPSQGTEFFSNLETLAKQSGCNIEMMMFKADDRSLANETEIDSVRFYKKCASLKFTGAYGQIIEFFKNINECPARLSLGNLNIRPSEDVQGLVCNIDITVYIREDKEPIPDEKF